MYLLSVSQYLLLYACVCSHLENRFNRLCIFRVMYEWIDQFYNLMVSFCTILKSPYLLCTLFALVIYSFTVDIPDFSFLLIIVCIVCLVAFYYSIGKFSGVCFNAVCSLFMCHIWTPEECRCMICTFISQFNVLLCRLILCTYFLRSVVFRDLLPITS